MLIALRAALHTLSHKVSYSLLFLSAVMFPHELKISASLIIYCHRGRCFGRLPTVWPRWLWSAHLCIRVRSPDELPSKLVIGGSGLRRWFIHKRASFNYSQIRSHGYPGGAGAEQRRWAIRSEPRATSQTTLTSPRLCVRVSWISNLRCSRQKRFQPARCFRAGLINLFMY